MQFERAQVVERILTVSDLNFVSTNLNPNLNPIKLKDVYAAVHEIQQLYLFLCVPYFASLSEINAKDEPDSVLHLDYVNVPASTFLFAVLRRLLQRKSRGLSFAEAQEAYYHAGEQIRTAGIDEAEFAVDYSDKKTVIMTLHTLNSIITKHAVVAAALDLQKSESKVEQRLARELLAESPGMITEEGPAKFLRAQAFDTALGAANDGITHFVAVFDIIWDDNQHLPLIELLNLTRTHVVKLMSKYFSWEAQILDTMLLADKNPYSLTTEQEVEENQSYHIFKRYILEDLAKKQPDYSQANLKRILKDSLVKLGIKGKEKEATEIVFDLAYSLVTTEGEMIAQELSSILSAPSLVEKRQKLLTSRNKAISWQVGSMKDDLLIRVTALAQIPVRLMSVLKEKESFEKKQREKPREARCMLLNVPSGFPNWITALIDSLLYLKSSGESD
jgi:hypothetical protein